MDDEKAAYIEDPRIPCQYGRKCYQKNPAHHHKYKHPPDPKRKKIFSNNGKGLKRAKPNDEVATGSGNEISDLDSEVRTTNNESEIVDNNKAEGKISNDVSNSESDEESILESLNNEKSTSTDRVGNTEDVSINEGAVCDHENGHNNEISRKFIKEKFFFEMPEDFYQFYQLCECLNKNNPSEALATIGLKLVGPFDVLCGKFCEQNKKDEEFLLHWRYFYDPPQMQTVLKGDDKTGYHIGYFRDSPEEKPVFMVENHGMKDGTLTTIGENIFGAVSSYIDDQKKTSNPFTKVQFNKFANIVKEEAGKLGWDLSRKTSSINKRNNKILTRTFNKIGLVVPYERKTQLGYRKLAMPDKDLNDLLTKIQKANPEQKQKLLGVLQAELLTWIDIAVDECDFGTGIELGWNILSHGVEDLNNTAARYLVSCYRQLKWDSFAKIAEVHLKNRKKSCNLSIV
ncbi:hypothetical protein HHI36_010749 [Cryptolaemus montrouzieri]|uniref:PBZ-type domain-containing protein n=1 Tax=Cryptolaemus montrouzieri TaxID=559131 RepID=A0ABD2MJQ6_9CUCU